MKARRGRLIGAVQGVGFRPFVASLARSLELRGHVANCGGRVEILVEGEARILDEFVERLLAEAPPAARIDEASWEAAPPGSGGAPFEILDSAATDDGLLGLDVDRRVCEACLGELGDPGDRRFAYPLNGCVACGPRLTIAAGSPWARSRSAMAEFPPCDACTREHADPGDRRWHAEAIACPRCGPSMWLEDLDGGRLSGIPEAIAAAVELLRRGQILGLMGVGGVQLMVDARDPAAVERLRARKRRPAKPLAVMVRDLEEAARLVVLDALARATLASAAGPIVLLPRHGNSLAPEVAPDQPRLGLMLPTTPAHALLLAGFGGPLVATSGNLHERPIAITAASARADLRGIADALLVHDRPILRRCDDSVVQLVAGQVRVLRLGRGLAPARFELPAAAEPILALGGHQQQTPVLALDGRALAWPCVGDLDDAQTRGAMAEAIDDLCQLIGRRPRVIACDAHPDYASTIWAHGQDHVKIEPVFHHHAHVVSTLVEHGRGTSPTGVLGVAWDGAGLGPDRGTWGGEFLALTKAGFARRLACLRPFPLPGGEAAARDGARALAGMLASAELDSLPVPGIEAGELERLVDLARRPRLSPTTSAVGRLFDAFAALLGLRRHSRHRAEAACTLEHAAAAHGPEPPYPFELGEVGRAELDWRPMLRAALGERDRPGRVAARVHATLIAMIVALVERHRPRPRIVALGGGCFANTILLAGTLEALRRRGVEVLAPRRLPPGDGGLALGQAAIVAARLARREETRACA